MTSIRIAPRAIAMGAALTLVTGALLATGAVNHTDASAAGAVRQMPVSRSLESATGIKVTGAHVMGSGGIVEIRYQVIDATKASIIEGDVNHTPKLTDVDSGDTLQDTAAMRHGHSMRNAGTYFLLYYNRDGAVKPGDVIDITINGQTLSNVPVQ